MQPCDRSKNHHFSRYASSLSIRGVETMSEPAQAAVADDVRAQLRYAVDNGKPRLYEIGTPGTDRGADTGDHICYEVMIRDGRQADAAFSLEEHGFAFVTAPSQVIDFANEETIRSAYYAEAEQLVLAQTGGKRAQIFDHTVRHGDDAKRRAPGLREPAFTVHNDHTHWSAPKRLRDILPSEADDLLTRRFAIVQTWRPIGGPLPPIRLLSPMPGRLSKTTTSRFGAMRQAEWAKFGTSSTTLTIASTICRICPRTKSWCSRFMTQRWTGAPATPRIALSVCRAPHQRLHRGRASRCGCSCFSNCR